MSNVFIVGGAGKVGKRLTAELVKRNHQVKTLYRNPEQTQELESLGAQPVFGNLTELEETELAEKFAGIDTVVFSAGAGGKGGEEMTNAIDGRGLELSVDAAMKAGVKRFMLVSAFPESGRGRQISETFENYMKVKKAADVYLAHSSLDWIILRPGTLSDDAGKGRVNLGLAIPYGVVSRDDVALCLAEIIDKPSVHHLILELTSGDTPVSDAVAQFAH
ncbi:NAD(P)H-binding protein [Vibrio sp. AK197]